ncbi:uncharacterized protein LOC6651390 [Drosophila willistoni]|uniref:uncharacterized protein LOC6651390 n=1 Tax=Drosophila willistoni TaxID=7260 RepID=UPI001F08430F|nr:uncharacterized protein LOC6651390 [Drosophila willistoni]
MLIKSNSKSFDLINEEKATKPQQPERLYQPRRLSWMKYIVIPTGIAFILLLILCNVDFSEHHTCIGKEINSTNCTNVTEYDSISYIRAINLTEFYSETQCLEQDEVTLYIEDVTIQLKKNPDILYNLKDIFGSNIVYSKLKVLNLRGTLLGDYLSENSFNNMPMLEDLNLGDCGLKSMELNTLGENVLNSLMYLDLSENNITSLTEDFIQALWDNNIDLETHATTTTTQGFVAFTPGVRTTSTTTTISPLITTDFDPITHSSTPNTTDDWSSSTITETPPITHDWPASTPQSTSTTEFTTSAVLECPTDSLYCAEIVCSHQDFAIPYQVIVQFEDIGSADNTVQVTLVPFISYLNYHLIYFNNDTQSNLKAIETSPVQFDSLDCATAYTFCIVLYENATDTSPYNCRSYRTGDCKQYGQDLSWFQNYFVMIISLGIVGILISVSLGIFMIYIILRLKPNWMKGSNRLIRPLRDSQTMFLLPRLTELGIPNRIKNDYDYINYYRRLERIKQCPPDSLKDNTPPKERAPSIPPSVSSSYNAASPTNSTSYLYETFELYEELP